MSRSCHSATFSSAGHGVAAQHPGQAADALAQLRVALVRHRRRALLARWRTARRPRAISVRCSRRISVAHAVRAWRAMTGQRRDELGVAVALQDLGRRPRPAPARAGADALLDFGGTLACVPTAPEILPTRISRAPLAAARGRGGPAPPRRPACGRRSSARRGRRGCGRSSACTCGGPPARRAPFRGAGGRRRAGRSPAAICIDSAVSITSDEVSPRWIQRPASPSVSATERMKESMSWCVPPSSSSMRVVVESAPADLLHVGGWDHAQLGPGLAHGQLDLRARRHLVLLGPDAAISGRV